MRLNLEQKKSLRDGFGDAIVEAGEKDKRIVVLTADLSESTRAHLFEKKFPGRFIQTGVAEQNMTGIGAGLALSGKIPFITSFSVFSPGGTWSTVRVSVCLSNANVKIVGSHTGFSNGKDGSTHQALEDIALTRVLPNMTVIAPCDYTETKKAVKAAAEFTGPVYLRLARDETPLITEEDSDFEIGKANVLKEGKDVTVIFCGPIGAEVCKAVLELEKEEINCELINCHTIKPLDKETIIRSVKKTKKVVTVEEHQINGGLGGAVAEILSEDLPAPLKRIGVNDSFGESGGYEELLKKYKIDSTNIKKTILDFVKKAN
jgi:transketolase